MIRRMKFGRIKRQHGRVGGLDTILDRIVKNCPHVSRIVPGRIKVRMHFPAELAGDILVHCHLVDHEDNGMMAVVRVEPAGGTSPMQKAELVPGLAPGSGFPICRASGSDD